MQPLCEEESNKVYVLVFMKCENQFRVFSFIGGSRRSVDECRVPSLSIAVRNRLCAAQGLTVNRCSFAHFYILSFSYLQISRFLFQRLHLPHRL